MLNGIFEHDSNGCGQLCETFTVTVSDQILGFLEARFKEVEEFR